VLRVRNIQHPGLQDALRILGIDGSAQLTSFTCPKLKNDGSVRYLKAKPVSRCSSAPLRRRHRTRR